MTTHFLHTSDAHSIRDRISTLLALPPRDHFHHVERAHLKTLVNAAIARERGWIVAKRSFGIEALKRGTLTRRGEEPGVMGHPELDHVAYFREAVRPYRPAAIITHAYCSADEVVACASRHGLKCEVLPWSWHFPVSCTAAILVRR